MALDDFSATWDAYTIAGLPVSASYGRMVNEELDKKTNFHWLSQGYVVDMLTGAEKWTPGDDLTYWLFGMKPIMTYKNIEATDVMLTGIDMWTSAYATLSGQAVYLFEVTLGQNGDVSPDHDKRITGNNVSYATAWPTISPYSAGGGTDDQYIWSIDIMHRIPQGSYITVYAKLGEETNTGPEYKSMVLRGWLPK